MAQLTAVILSHHTKMPHLHEGQDLDHQLQLSELEIFFSKLRSILHSDVIIKLSQ